MGCALKQNVSETAAARAAAIRDKNDAFRKSFSGWRVLLTPGVTNLSADHQQAVISAVKKFDDFSPDNDVYGEHDFGAVPLEDAVFFWKIDYYDLDLQFGSSDPADDNVTCRVLTVMRADEY
ncbi:DUF3768 domain-containing protein [Agrobacterium fabrum]|uniref:DUF3768 domain-containing protein n=1 Tax=Agrobacterium fabrum TaxID=1176649 RepID=UPI0015733BE4|nr:DUF3768 domain-containing protein [Agrobacterium fabrum]WIE30617.1 DUF3768 domain-containing protein [Agrobacterium fabrum]WIE46565.1 DUF3768 domain-containing protein [Agrobacterium fabrum]